MRLVKLRRTFPLPQTSHADCTHMSDGPVDEKSAHSMGYKHSISVGVSVILLEQRSAAYSVT